MPLTSPARPLALALAAALASSVLLAAPSAQAKEVDAFPTYQGQVSCDPVAKPGVLAARRLLLAKFGGGSGGITRACSSGGLSEHKEGRAWDWSLRASKAKDRRTARRATTWLTRGVKGEAAARGPGPAHRPHPPLLHLERRHQAHLVVDRLAARPRPRALRQVGRRARPRLDRAQPLALPDPAAPPCREPPRHLPRPGGRDPRARLALVRPAQRQDPPVERLARQGAGRHRARPEGAGATTILTTRTPSRRVAVRFVRTGEGGSRRPERG